MHTPLRVPDDRVIPPAGGLRVMPSGPSEGETGDSAEMILRLAQDHDRIAERMNDVVVRRLFAAGLCLETALGLIGDHTGTANVQEAIGQLDLAIRDFRNVLFDRHRPDPPSVGQPG
jgi:hypothetical protein